VWGWDFERVYKKIVSTRASFLFLWSLLLLLLFFPSFFFFFAFSGLHLAEKEGGMGACRRHPPFRW